MSAIRAGNAMVRHSERDPVPSGLYPRLLGEGWGNLDEAVRRAHAPGRLLRASGRSTVRRGRGLWARLLLRPFALAREGNDMNVAVTVERDGSAERWLRSFGTARLDTVQCEAAQGVLVERFGPFEFRFRLAAVDAALVYTHFATLVRIGQLALPLPRSVAPRIYGREERGPGADSTHVAVDVKDPRGRLLFSYEGSITWTCAA